MFQKVFISFPRGIWLHQGFVRANLEGKNSPSLLQFLLNEIADNAIGVIMDRGSSAKFTKNAVRDNARYGVLVQGQGTFGLLNDNDVAGGAYGVSVSDGAAPSVLQNRVSGTRECAVLLNCAGAAKVNENEIFDNAGDAVQVTQCAVQVCAAAPRGRAGSGAGARGGTWASHAHGNTARQVMDGLWTEARGQQKQSNEPGNNQHNLNTLTTGHR